MASANPGPRPSIFGLVAQLRVATAWTQPMVLPSSAPAAHTHLLLHDLFSIIVVNTHSMKAWHFALPVRNLFLGIRWEGEVIIGKTLGYGRSVSDAELFGPWPWGELILAWHTGLGDRLTMSPINDEND